MKNLKFASCITLFAVFTGQLSNAGTRANDPKVDRLAGEFETGVKDVDLEGKWKCKMHAARPGFSWKKHYRLKFTPLSKTKWKVKQLLSSRDNYPSDHISITAKGLVEGQLRAFSSDLNHSFKTVTASYRGIGENKLIVEIRDQVKANPKNGEIINSFEEHLFDSRDTSIADKEFTTSAYMSCKRR